MLAKGSGVLAGNFVFPVGDAFDSTTNPLEIISTTLTCSSGMTVSIIPRGDFEEPYEPEVIKCDGAMRAQDFVFEPSRSRFESFELVIEGDGEWEFVMSKVEE